MALTLHAEYLLGYLAGAKNLAPRDVAPFANLDAHDPSTQARALMKSLALGLSDGRKGAPVRDATELRACVLAMIGPQTGPRRAAENALTTGEYVSAVVGERASETELRVEADFDPPAETG